LEEGVRFFDNAPFYSGGKAEERYGKFLTPKYRDVSFIMTKTLATNASTRWPPSPARISSSIRADEISKAITHAKSVEGVCSVKSFLEVQKWKMM
jgi:aryl-alcohol dehydrogenase-like predicted oxidoreductase